MTAADNMLNELMTGAIVGTDNATCRRLGCNQIPDITRKLRNKGIPVLDREVKIIRFGRPVRCKQYYLDNSYIRENTKSA